MRGDYNTEALIFKMVMLIFLKKKYIFVNKMKENAVALVIMSNYKKNNYTLQATCK